MSSTNLDTQRLQPRPLPDNITSVQPGGGRCYRLELIWGRCRRWYLRTFRPKYVAKMAKLRNGSTEGCPHEVLDPRDLKFCRNLCDAEWASEHDQFRWRDRLPFARWGLAELQLMGWPLLAATIAVALCPWPWCLTAVVPGVLLALVVWFFRDPPRHISTESGLIVSPADGTIVEISHLEHDEFIDGPAVRIGIFLSIFNVHINRAPEQCRVIDQVYRPGLFLNALKTESLEHNESLWIGLEQEETPHRRMSVRQISGLLARRIVCQLRPGEVVQRGEKFGMIKLGSRTEMTLPAGELTVEVTNGQKVKAGSTIIGRYQEAQPEQQ